MDDTNPATPTPTPTPTPAPADQPKPGNEKTVETKTTEKPADDE